MTKKKDFKPCAHCGRPVAGGGYGDFDNNGEFKSFCKPSCRTAFIKANARKGQVSLTAFGHCPA
jgi:hypothetical protein